MGLDQVLSRQFPIDFERGSWRFPDRIWHKVILKRILKESLWKLAKTSPGIFLILKWNSTNGIRGTWILDLWRGAEHIYIYIWHVQWRRCHIVSISQELAARTATLSSKGDASQSQTQTRRIPARTWAGQDPKQDLVCYKRWWDADIAVCRT